MEKIENNFLALKFPSRSNKATAAAAKNTQKPNVNCAFPYKSDPFSTMLSKSSILNKSKVGAATKTAKTHRHISQLNKKSEKFPKTRGDCQQSKSKICAKTERARSTSHTEKHSIIDTTAPKTSSSNESCKSNQEFTYLDTRRAWEYVANFKLDEAEFDEMQCQLEQVTISKANISAQIDSEDEEKSQSLNNHVIPYISSEIIENDPFCHFCHDCKLDEIAYPCRVCTRVYHLSCVEKRGLFRNDREKQIFLQAYSNIGWSCFDCCNLSRLIPETEIREIIDSFEFSDTDQDYGISKEEFLWMQKEDFYQRLGEEMTPELVEIANLRFELTDTDQSGFIDWSEYLNFECTRRLYRMPEDELVLKLTPKEIQRARDTFRCFDKDMNGNISWEEAARVHRDWFVKIYQMKLVSRLFALALGEIN